MHKRVLQVNKFYHPWVGGVETVVKQIAEGLQNDFEMSVLVCDDQLNKTTEEERVKVVKAKTWKILLGMPVSFEFLKLFKKMVVENDVIHIHLPYPLGVLAAFLNKNSLKDKKVVVTYHSDIVRQKWIMPFYKPLLLWFLKRADKIITTSPRLRNNSKILSKFRDKVEVIPLGIKLKQKHEEKKQTEDYILFVGRLVKYKGLQYLIKAIKNTQENLKVVGTGSLEQDLKKLTQKIGLENKVEFLGFVPDEKLNQIYKNVKMFVLPSISSNEAFGVVQLEAMSYTLPIINTNLYTGVPWVARDGKEAITVQPKSIKDLKNAIKTLSDNPELRKQLGNSGLQRLKEKFQLKDMLEKYREIYCELL